MSSSKGIYFDFENESRDENEKLEISRNILNFRNKTCKDYGKHATTYI